MPDLLDRLKTALSDRYAIEREIGAGGMATVYLAEDLKLHRKVAVKVLRPELAAVLGPERFLREIEIAANLNHPHILPLFDSGEADGFLYFVMPFVEGETLRDKVDREKHCQESDGSVHECGQVCGCTTNPAFTLPTRTLLPARRIACGAYRARDRRTQDFRAGKEMRLRGELRERCMHFCVMQVSL